MNKLKKIPPAFRNKFFLAGGIFLIWLTFFDERDLITTHFHHKNELRQLEKSRDFYIQQLKETSAELNLLKNDPNTLEQYAREKYRMKKDGEDLFIIQE